MKNHRKRQLPPSRIKVNIYIDPDGSVTFAYLLGDILPVAYKLDTENPKLKKLQRGMKVIRISHQARRDRKGKDGGNLVP